MILFAAFIIAGTIAYAIRDAAQIIAEAIEGMALADDEEDDASQPWES